ncbi:MAG: TRAP-type C4-dicarboxylate transport system permease small subunit [Alphaproteobacteria bacterium]|jgi:TRAP-type C4-dicarboxylate transport system permease small subunit
MHLLVAVFIGLMLFFGSLDVTMRYVFDAPLSWGLPVVGLMLGLTIFSGMIIVTGEDEHITVGLLDRWVIGRGKKIQTIAVHVVSLGSVFFIAERMLASGLQSYENQNQHMMIDLSIWPFAIIFSVLSFIAGLLIVRNLFRVLTKRDQAD